MRSRSLWCFSFLLLLLGVFLSPPFSRGQNPTSPPYGPRTNLPQIEEPPTAADEAHARAEKEMAKKANKERQQQIKRDADRLFELATQLKTYVDKTNENILSLDVIRKADEIEKLAHSVKEKMKSQ